MQYKKLKDFVVKHSSDYYIIRPDSTGQMTIVWDNILSRGRFKGETATIKNISSGMSLSFVWEGENWQQI